MILLKVNSSLVRDRIKNSGINLCKCCEFDQSVWLTFGHGTKKVHGEGYPIEELDMYNVEDVLNYLYQTESDIIDCGYDVEKFIKLCKEHL